MVVIAGGTIPAEDITELKKIGVAEIFTPGASTQEIVDFVRGAVKATIDSVSQVHSRAGTTPLSPRLETGGLR